MRRRYLLAILAMLAFTVPIMAQKLAQATITATKVDRGELGAVYKTVPQADLDLIRRGLITAAVNIFGEGLPTRTPEQVTRAQFAVRVARNRDVMIERYMPVFLQGWNVSQDATTGAVLYSGAPITEANAVSVWAGLWNLMAGAGL